MSAIERESSTRKCRTEGCPNHAHEIVTVDPEGNTTGMLFASPYCRMCAGVLAEEAAAEERARQIMSLLDRSGIPLSMSDWSIRTYPVRDQTGHAAYVAARKWIEEYRDGVRVNLYLHGPVGVGKTGLAVSIIRRLCEEGVAAYFTVWRDLLEDMRDSFEDDEAPPSGVSRMRGDEVVALDDLGAERPTPFALEQLAGLIQRRFDSRLPVIVTSNYSPDALLRHFGNDVIAGRILDRLVDEAHVVGVSGASRRRGIFGRRGAGS